MTYNRDIHHRQSLRLKTHDYTAAGAYFVTICTQGRMCVIDDAIVRGIITDVWHALPRRFPTIALDEFVVMPNHIHLTVWLQAGQTVQGQIGQGQALPLHGAPDAGAREWVIPEPTRVNANPKLGDVIGAFKSLVTTVYLDWIEAHDPKRSASFWQRNYYEHVVRNERELLAIRQYIIDNPLRWELDMDNPQNIRRRTPATKVEDYLADMDTGARRQS